MTSHDDTNPTATSVPSRKPYSTPQLHVYGDFRRLTQSVGNMGEMDGLIGKYHATQPGPWNP